MATTAPLQVNRALMIVPDSAASEASRLHPLNIHFHYALSNNTSQEDQLYLRTKLLPATAAVLRQFIQIKHPPPGGVLRLAPECEYTGQVCTGNSCRTSCEVWAERKCGNVRVPPEHSEALETCVSSASGINTTTTSCFTTPAGAGVQADMLIYVTNESVCEEGTLASTVSCASDSRTNRPVAGAINFCALDKDQFQKDLMVSVHEMIHFLGMSARFFNISANAMGDSKFVDDALNPLKMSDVVEAYNNAKGRRRYRVVTPEVQAAVRHHFNCRSLRGATLEDDLGNSARSHWDRRQFEGEIMGPIVGVDTAAGRHVLTNVTLALLKDTGWYVVDYRVSGFNHWGYQAGCVFAESSAREVKASQDSSVQRFTCQRQVADATECTVDLTSRGICITGNTSFDGLDFLQEQGTACLRSQVKSFTESEAAYGQYHGPGSRCILQSPGFSRQGFEALDSAPEPSAGCYKTFCKGEEGDRQLYVEFEGSGVQVACPSGAFVDLSEVPGLDFTGRSLLGPCPNREVLCGRGEDEEGLRECGSRDCTANGDCLRGGCHCHIGYIGDSCNAEICADDSSCEPPQACHWSGQCLSPREAALPQFQFRSGTLSFVDAGAAPTSSSSLTDAAKLGIMLSMAALLLVISCICVWLLLRNRTLSHAAPVISPGNSSRKQSEPSSLQLPEASLTPRQLAVTPKRAKRSARMHPPPPTPPPPITSTDASTGRDQHKLARQALPSAQAEVNRGSFMSM